MDDQPWPTATSAQWHDPDTWRRWRVAWDAPLGTHNLQVRATDGTGAVRAPEVTPTVPDGAGGWDQSLTPVVPRPSGS